MQYPTDNYATLDVAYNDSSDHKILPFMFSRWFNEYLKNNFIKKT